jgi:PAS domain S-box-containing protein
MKANQKKSETEALREKAEKRIKDMQTAGNDVKPDLSEADALKLIHELQVHQIELELQNEELLMAKRLAETASKKYIGLFNCIPAGFFILTRQGEIVEVNRKGAAMLNKEPVQCINNAFGFFLAEKSKSDFSRFLADTFYSNSERKCDVIIETAGNLPKYLDLSGIVSENSEYCYIAAVDISDRVNAGNASFVNNELLNLFMKHSPIYAFIKEVSATRNQVLAASENFKEMLGIAGSEMVGKTMQQLFPAEIADKMIADDWAVVSGNIPVTIEEEMNGHYYSTIKYPIELHGQKLLAGYTIDITDRRHAEAQLNESSAIFRSFVEQSSEGLGLINADGIVVEWNHSLCKITGISSDEAIGKYAWDIQFNLLPAHVRNKDLLEKLRSNTLHTIMDCNNSDSVKYHEIVLHTEEGEVKTVLESLFPVKLQSKYLIGMSMRDITNRKKAEVLLRENEEKYRIVADNTYDWEAWRTPDGNFRYISPSIERITGYKLAEFLKDPNFVTKITHADDQSMVVSLLNYAFQEDRERVVEYDFRIVLPDGTIRWISHSSTPVYGDSGEWLGRRESNRDITARKLVEEKLSQAYARQRHFINSNIIGVVVASADGKVFETNDYFLNLVGYSHEEFVAGQVDWRSITPPEWLNTDEKAIQELSETGICAPYEKEYQRRDGTRVSVMITDTMLPGPENHIAGFILDITDRKKNELALAKSEERLRLVLKASNDGPWDWDLETNLLYYSPRYWEMLGYMADELEPDPMLWVKLMHPADREHIEQFFAKLMAQGPDIYEVEFRLLHKAGHYVPVLSRGFIQRNVVGKVVRVSGSNVDLTSRKKAGEEIRLKNEQLTRANDEKDKYFSVIAHELRGPFTAFLGFTRILAEKLPALRREKIQKIALSMQKSAINLYSLLENLLEWSRMQRGLIGFRAELFNLWNKIASCIDLYTDAAEKKNIRIINNVPDDLLIFADGNMLGSIIRNLLSNAIKYTNKGGLVTISASKLPDHSVMICVADTGIGMDQALIGNLFRLNEPVYRRGTDEEPSTGLGLIISREFIEKHGGTLSIESHKGKGTTFCFTIPGEPSH